MKNLSFILIFLTILFSACQQIYPLNLGDGYKIEYDPNSYFIITDTNNTVVVNGHITKFTYDSTFIVMEQMPVYKNNELIIDKVDSLYEKNKLRFYWILNKKEKCVSSFDSLNMCARYSNVYGPFTKNEYLQKREELKIPKELVFKEE